MRAFDWCLRWLNLGGEGRAWPEKEGCSHSRRRHRRRHLRLAPTLAPGIVPQRHLQKPHLEQKLMSETWLERKNR
jgi:hypothetical protein